MATRFSPEHFARLTPSSRQHLLDRVVKRVNASPELYPCNTIEEAQKIIETELANEVAYLMREHDTMEFLPCPPGYAIQTCRCGAAVYRNAATLSRRNPFTLNPHICDVHTKEEQKRQHLKVRHQQEIGRRNLKATRSPGYAIYTDPRYTGEED